jgi:hypothetical protein
MDNIKGNAALNIGYSCKQRELVNQYTRTPPCKIRTSHVFSVCLTGKAVNRSRAGERSGVRRLAPPTRTPPTVSGRFSVPLPVRFTLRSYDVSYGEGNSVGIVTLASSGSEGGPNMGAMRLAQTAGYGVLPNPEIPYSFFAQAGDLEDEWGPSVGPCFSGLESQWGCCSSGDAKHPTYLYQANRSSESCKAGTKGKPEMCDPACAAVWRCRQPDVRWPAGRRVGPATPQTSDNVSGPAAAIQLRGGATSGAIGQLTVEDRDSQPRRDPSLVA